MKIHFLKTMWSDIILLQGGHETAMIDAGTEEQFPMIRSYLEGLGVRSLSFILLTHFHRDHYGSIPALLGHMPVGTVYLKEYSGLDVMTSAGKPADDAYRRSEMAKYRAMQALAREKSRLRQCEETDAIPFEGTELKLYNQRNSMRAIYEDASRPETYRRYAFSENQNSLAALMEVNGARVFFGGDVHDTPSTHPLADCVSGQIARQIGGPVDLYKAPHHGTKDTGRPETVAAYRPRIAVITNGREYLPPDSEVFRNLRAADPSVRIYLTEEQHVVADIREDGEIAIAGTPLT